ncbi:helix-turn-helix domain-containing protein [Aquiflexum sp.]|uniref:helix-turn-helix domain-containing protein n=1 Tax=Aquiflexum sp. TaxID=1872584 RepID=UPI0035948D09
MKLVLSYHTQILVKKVIEKEIEKLGIEFAFCNSGQVEFLDEVDDEVLGSLKLNLQEYGIYVQSNHQQQLIQRIKDAIDELVYNDDNYKYNPSNYISDKLNLNYTYLSNLFSEYTLTTLQTHIISTRIERAKNMMLSGEYKLSEIAYKLNYSSVSHLSNQFKKTTGLTASHFLKIISKRNITISDN